MQVSYNYYEVLEKFYNKIKFEVTNLQKELSMDTSSTTAQNLNQLINQKITYLRHMLLRFYSLNEWITTNYDYYCKANITNHVLDLREKGFKSISTYYYHLAADLRHKKTPIWAVDMAVMNTTGLPSDLYSKQVMKYLVNKNFEIPSPIEMNKKKEFVEKLNSHNLKIVLKDIKLSYISEGINCMFDILGDEKHSYMSIEFIEITDTNDLNVDIVKDYLNTSLKRVNPQSYSLDNLIPSVKEVYESIRDEDYYKLIISINLIEKYIFEYKLNLLEDKMAGKETDSLNQGTNKRKLEFFCSSLEEPKKGRKKTKSFLRIPFLSEEPKINCRLEFGRQNKTKLFLIFWDDYKNVLFSIQTVIVEISFTDLNLEDNKTLIIKMHGFELTKEIYIVGEEMTELFRKLLNLSVNDEQKADECLFILKKKLAFFIIRTIYIEIIKIFEEHCPDFLKSIVKIGFNVLIDYNTGSLLLYSLKTNKLLGGIPKGKYNTDIIKSLEECKLQSNTNEYIHYLLKNIISYAYVLYVQNSMLYEAKVEYTYNINKTTQINYKNSIDKLIVKFKETNVMLNITDDLKSSYFSFNDKKIDYENNEEDIQLDTIPIYKNYSIINEASFTKIACKLKNVYFAILNDKIEDFITELRKVGVSPNVIIQSNKKENNKYYLTIKFNKCLFSEQYFEMLNQTLQQKFIQTKGNNEMHVGIKAAFKESFFIDLKVLVTNSLKIENIKEKLTRLEIKDCSFVGYNSTNSFFIQYKNNKIEVNSDLQLKFGNLVWNLPETQLSYCLEAFENAIEYKESLDKIMKDITKNQRSIYEFCDPFSVLGFKENETCLDKNVKYVLREVFDMDIYFYGTKIYTTKIKPFNKEDTVYTGASYIRSARHMVWSVPTFYSIKFPLYFFESCKNLLFLRLAYTDYLITNKSNNLQKKHDLNFKMIEDKLIVATASDRINKLVSHVNGKLTERLILLFFKSLKSEDFFILLKIMSLEALERACCIIMNVEDRTDSLSSTFRVSLSNKKFIMVEFEYNKTKRNVSGFKILLTSFKEQTSLKNEVENNLKVLVEKANKRFEGGSRKDVIVDNSELAPQILELILRGLCGQVYK